MDERLTLLKELCLAFGPTGCEGNVADIIRSKLEGLCDEVSYDRDGCVTALKKGDGSTDKRVMISAHMDEVGFMVTHIDDEGYIHFCCVGGIDARVICGRKVTFGDENKKITGIVASKAIHHQSADERTKATPVDHMYVDIGANNREDAEKYVQPGDFGTFDCDFVLFGNDMLRSKAIDDRLGCAVMLNVLLKLKESGKTLPFDLYCAFTTREEVGRSGAATAAYRINPDIGIILESTAISDVADTPEECTVAKTGEGGAISLMDYGTIYDSGLVEKIFEVAKANDIKCQVKRYVSGGNDARVIQQTREGKRVLAISAPTRYIHTPSNVINVNDYYAIGELVYAFLTGEKAAD